MPDAHIDIIATAAGKAWVKQAAPPVIPLARPQAFPALPPTANRMRDTPTPVYRHPSGAQQLGTMRIWDDSVTGAPQNTTAPGIATAPKSPGVDSGPGVLRISQHGGTARGGSYMLSNPTNADINISSRAANDWAFEPALPANTNPSCLISDSCNSNADGGGADPSLYARWLKSEQTAGQPQTAPNGLNLNKVVMMPPGYQSQNAYATNLIAEGGSFESPYMHGSFPAPAQEEIRQINAARGQFTSNAPHEYRLLPGGDPTSQGSWIDTGNYTDARQSSIPLIGAFGEAREMGRHFGLGKDLGGGGVNSYLDKIRNINNNPDATYMQKVRSNFARPVGSALQFGREVGGIGHDVVAPLLRAREQVEAVNKRVMGPGYLPAYRSSEKAGAATADAVIASAAGKAWAKRADLLPEVNLQDHQQRIADRVSGENPRMLIYHGLGSGKSLSALAAAEAAQKLYGGNYGIVVPASLKGNFQKEVKKFTRGSNPEVMSYTGLGKGKQFQDQPETLIMDEAARLRNPNAAMTQAAMRQAREAKRLMLLTGTPITNSPTDLAPLVSMLQGKNIDPKSFGERYVGYEKVKPGWLGWLKGVKPGQRPYIKNEKELRDLLKGHVDYQPSKTPEGVNVNEEIIRTPLSKEQQKIQKAIRTKIPPGFLWKLDQEFPLSKDELARLNGFLTGMRQVGLSTQPFRADKNYLKAFDQSSKLTTAMQNLHKTLDEDPRKKALIYSNFVDAGINPYAAALERDKIPYGIFHGSIPTAKRQQALQDYNEGKLRALLLGPAGAEGISTKGTSLIQLLDPHWHESRSQQARGRGLRFDSHEGLPEELKNVAVQRYLSSSEDPSSAGKLMGYTRERTGDEVLARLAADKEMLNDKFRKILQEEGTQKTSAEVSLTGARAWYKAAALPNLSGLLAPKAPAPAPAPPPASPTPPSGFTNQYVPKPAPPTVTPGEQIYPHTGGGVPAGSWKKPPPLTTVLPITPQLSHAREMDFIDNPTTNAWESWLKRNYSTAGDGGDSRLGAHASIVKHLNSNRQAQPNASATYAKYTNILDNRFANAQRQARRPFNVPTFPDRLHNLYGLPTNKLPLVASHVGRLSEEKPSLVVGGKEQFMGQQNSLIGQVGSAFRKPSFDYMPSMTRGLVGLHEMEHVNQKFPYSMNPYERGEYQPEYKIDRSVPSIPPNARLEPAAVLNEITQGVDAATQATGKPVPGEMALTPTYKPKLNWMRQQALQHQLENVGDRQHGKTMTELLNTPEGQAWQRMQLQQLDPQEHFRELLNTPKGRAWQHSPEGQAWQHSPEGQAWQRMQLQQLAPQEKQNALALTSVRNWYKTAASERAQQPRAQSNKKKPARTPWLIPGLAGAGALSSGLAYGMANDQQISNVREAIKNYDPNSFTTGVFPENHTGLTYYEKTLAPAAQLKPFGTPVGQLLVKLRSSPAVMKALGTEDYLLKSPADQLGVGGLAHYNSFANGPVPAYAHQLNSRLSSEIVPEELAPAGTRYGDWMERKLKDFTTKQIGNAGAPLEITPEFMPNAQQEQLMKDFYKSLPLAEQQYRAKTENPGSPYAKQMGNYLPKAKMFSDLRDNLKNVGFTGIGAGAGGAAGHYLMRNRKNKSPLGYWASVLGGTGLGGAASYLGGTEPGQKHLAQIVQALRGLKKQ